METDFMRSIDLTLRQLSTAREDLLKQERLLREMFAEMLRPHLKPGAVVDTRKPGPCYAAGVVAGRAYGTTFQITSHFSVKVDVAHPSLSRWSLQAISVKDGDPEKKLGKPFHLSGRVVPGPRGEDESGTEDQIVLAGMEWLRANA